jgi:hypothetical protein
MATEVTENTEGECYKFSEFSVNSVAIRLRILKAVAHDEAESAQKTHKIMTYLAARLCVRRVVVVDLLEREWTTTTRRHN